MVNKHFLYWFPFFSIIIVDQITKYLARIFLEVPFEIFSFFSFSLVQNKGAGFGILQGKTIFLISISLIVVAVLIYYYHKLPQKEIIWFSLIAGGATGNLIDRIIFSSVTDFITITNWPSFNIADSSISIGITALIILSIIDWKKKN